MVYEMNRIGWRFAGTRGGRLVFRRGQDEIAFKSLAGVRSFLDGQNV